MPAAVRAEREQQARESEQRLERAEHTLAQATGGAEKPNQLCWLCDERLACARRPDGWECRTCQHIT